MIITFKRTVMVYKKGRVPEMPRPILEDGER
jgi:hypothetical protein